MTTEEEMRLALFGPAGPVEQPKATQIPSPAIVDIPSSSANHRKSTKRFVPKLKVTLRVGNEFEGDMALFTYEADTLSTLQAELDAKKMARKKYRFIEVVSIQPAQ